MIVGWLLLEKCLLLWWNHLLFCLIFFLLNMSHIDISFWQGRPGEWLILGVWLLEVIHFLLVHHKVIGIRSSCHVIVWVWVGIWDFFYYCMKYKPALGASVSNAFFFRPARLLSVRGNLFPFSPLSAYGLNFW